MHEKPTYILFASTAPNPKWIEHRWIAWCYIKNKSDVWEPVSKGGNTFEITADEFLDELEITYSSSQLEKDLEMNTIKFFSDVVENFERGECLILWIS